MNTVIGKCKECFKNTALNQDGLCKKCQLETVDSFEMAEIRAKLLRFYYSEFGAKSVIANWQKLADNLSRLVKRDKAWTARYIRSIANGDKGFRRIPAQLKQAIEGYSPKIVFTDGFAVENTVSKYQLPVGSIILGKPRKCKWRDCNVWFVPKWDSQLYHTKKCKKLARNERRKKQRVQKRF